MNEALGEPEPVMVRLKLPRAETPRGELLLSLRDRSVVVSAFEPSGFTGGINWYRNLDRNWHLLAGVDPVVRQPALMIYGDRDGIPQSADLTTFVPGVDVVTLDCGHWIQQEKPEETNQAILKWLSRPRV